MNRDYTLTRALSTLAFAIVAFQAPICAQTLEYSKIDVSGRVKITVPAHWHVRDAAERKNIAASADATANPTGKPSEPIHVASLSVVSLPEPIRAIIRVSFIDAAGSQADLNRMIAKNRKLVLDVFKGAWEAEKSAIAEVLAKQGGKYLGQEAYRIETIGTRTALVVTYKRSDPLGGGPFVVTQYHIPMGKDKILITLSYQESHVALFRPILDRVKNSIVIRR